jgi:hypothetical protein
MLEQNHDKVQDNIMRHKLIVTRSHTEAYEIQSSYILGRLWMADI